MTASVFGKDHTNHRAPASVKIHGRIVQFEMSAVILNNLADDCETEAGALLARGHVGFEQLLAVVPGRPLPLSMTSTTSCSCER